jgi:hypothetical protein
MEYALVWLNRLSRALRLSWSPMQIQLKRYFGGLAVGFHQVVMGLFDFAALPDALPVVGGDNFTPARRALERPMAMACFVDRAPCFPAWK